ncbi:alkane 1-monooxygenase [Rhodocytophaga aerolata]|uniref:Alkane 1-monooxygenase n=1 Tax=Rhodocytophaga aerolata TaxID=455078 RepID=A0ABT8RCC0_9BACT|nr:alkane 1-monooxygenase [Rhodocytophaga aerolata]MDO1448828.1 alkane 1-monooxygenase [Rhodocytophaga aerolata]
MKPSVLLLKHKYAYIWKEAGSLSYLVSLLPALLVIAGNVLGGHFTMMNSILSGMLLPLADWVLPTNTQKPKSVAGTIPDCILLLAVLSHALAVISLIFGIYTESITGEWIWAAAISTGFSSGILGINSAHELIHRKKKWLQNLGIWNLFLANYTHFYIEHRLGHHVRVGTMEDPATARYNESFYHFFIRTVPAQWKSGLQIEVKRLSKQQKRRYGLQNFVIRSMLCQITRMVLLAVWLGTNVFWAYAIQSIFAFFLLEFVNYIEHYGLARQKGELVNIHHSWQSDAISSRFTLFELSRHSDHHVKAYKPYYLLESHEDSYVLPSGYFGMFYIGMIPPLWFRLINPLIHHPQAN